MKRSRINSGFGLWWNRVRQQRRRLQRRRVVEGLENRHLLTGISIDDVSAGEEDGTALFTVTLSQSSGSTITVDYDTQTATAVDGTGGDFTAKSGTLTFDPYVVSKTISVSLASDTDKESNETFKIALSNASGATIDDSEGIGVIVHDDAEGVTNQLDSLQYAGGEALHAGNVALPIALPNGLTLKYNTNSHATPIIALETVQPDDGAVPTALKAEFYFDSTLEQTVHYDTTGLSAGDPLRFVFQADATAKSSGTYDFKVVLTETHSAGESYREFNGSWALVNEDSSPFGDNWMLVEETKLAVDTDWVTMIFGKGAAASYDRSEISGGGGGPGGGPGPRRITAHHQTESSHSEIPSCRRRTKEAARSRHNKRRQHLWGGNSSSGIDHKDCSMTRTRIYGDRLGTIRSCR